MTVQKVIYDMEKEFDEKFMSYYWEQNGRKWILKPITEPSFFNLRKYLRTLLESFGEEMIDLKEDDNFECSSGDYECRIEKARIKGRNQHIDEQRLKVKEIISSIGK